MPNTSMSRPILPSVRGLAAAMLIAVGLTGLAVTGAAAETRCGWFVNPTPGNFWLTDADGDWMIAQQMGYEARGIDNMPEVNEREFKATNGSYGYGCACITGTFDAARERVTRIMSSRTLPLRQCRADRNLPPPPED